MPEEGIHNDDIWFICDRCGERITHGEVIDEDGMFCTPCYEKLIEREG